MLNLLLCSTLWASPLGESETSYSGATILQGDVDVTFDYITNIDQEEDPNAYAFFEGNTLYLGNSDQYDNSVDGIVEFFWFQSSIDRGTDFYVAVIKARANPGDSCPWYYGGTDCELWADDWQDFGEHSVLSVEAKTDINREQGAFRWDWAVPFENYGIDAYGQVTFANQYGIGANAEGAVMSHGEIMLDEEGNTKAAGDVQVKGFISSDYMVQTQYEVTLYEWEVYVNGRADLMTWDTYLNLGVRANQAAYHEYFMSIQVEQGQTFVLDEINLFSHFDIGNINPFAKELGLSLKNIEIGAPFWNPEEEIEDPIEPEPDSEPAQEELEETEPDLSEDSDMPSLSFDGEPVKSGCSSTNKSVDFLSFFLLFLSSLVIRRRGQ